MGFRTTVILFNDQMSEWRDDPELGRKIAQAANFVSASSDHLDRASIKYGRVVECAHADLQTLAVLESYNMQPMAHTSWFQGQSDNTMQLSLLRQAAEKLGYKLVKKPA